VSPTLSVGQLYHPERTRWLEGVEYSYDRNGHTLLLIWSGLDHQVVEAVRKGRVDLALWARGGVVILLYRIEGACDWSDAPYSWHIVPPERRQLPPMPAAEERALLSVILVDADTGLVRVLRAVTMATTFTRRLHGEIAAQASAQWDAAAYDEELRLLYASHSTAALLATAASTCRGGE
jgi:hypothetical protein